MVRTRKGALGGRETYGTQTSIAAMKCMLFRSLTDPRLSLVAENVETRIEVSSAPKRGGKSFGRI